MDYGAYRKYRPEGPGADLDPAAGRVRDLPGSVADGTTGHEDYRQRLDKDHPVQVRHCDFRLSTISNTYNSKINPLSAR